ncbi:MazG nucleotide pyrophosphohydrolase domain-containing protein [Micrococcus sp.]|uniref:MazG nucleotide pyrophosphohydrolase domain-containing protein n=1 Tax=Micrococcus sp. TaxID=1271 RepID=UPI002A90CDB0|nr:MazG nucleotide pyrophosphohydrolase domain-containing protein [Micrococcus sp.]MDY6055374.1 MazG nucleotide pyrophosphohydrolase domain-containing protein [Micrococcus sp.]
MSQAVDRLVAVVDALRDHCPWTAALTHADLGEYLVEESYEALEQVEAHDAEGWRDAESRRADGSTAALAAELGDVLFQVVLHAAVSRPAGAPASAAGFDLDAVAEALTAKMIRRNPLVFTPQGHLRPAEELAGITPEDVERAWQRAKQAEQRAAAEGGTEDGPDDAGAGGSAGDGPSAGPGPDPDPYGGIPARLPALAAAALMVDRAGRQGGGAPSRDCDAPAWADEAALGAELFALVGRARAAGLDPERALRGEIARRRRR